MSEERNYEAEAKIDGWAPLEEWRGDPDEWKSAEEFVKIGEKIDLKGKVKSLSSKIEEQSSKIENLLNTNKEFKTYTDAQLKKEKEENARLLAELKAQRKEAVATGDGEAFEKANDQIAEIEKEQPQDLDRAAYDKIANDWAMANSWYNTDEDLTIYADGLADKVFNEGYTGKAYFDELTRRVKAKHPDKFGKKPPNPVEPGGQIEVIDSNERTYDNLPKEAKDKCDQFVRDIPGFKKEDYVSTYEWD